MATWIKETDQAFYLMEGEYYLEKTEKQPRPEGVGFPGEKVISLDVLKQWLTGSEFEIPGAMVIAVGIDAPEPTMKPVPAPTLDIIDKPDFVQAGEAFVIKVQASKTLVGKPADLYVEINNQFYLQTTNPAKKPKVNADGTFQFEFRFSSPGNRRLKVTVDDLSQIFAIDVKAAFNIIRLPSKVISGEAFTISGTAPLDKVGQPVQLLVNNQLQPSTVKVKSNGAWQFRFGLFSLGKRTIKIAIGNQSLERPIQVILRPLFESEFKVPEVQLSSPNYPRINSPVLRSVIFTGGFMEPYGHSRKPTSYAIFSSRPSSIQTLNPSPRNYGIDYVVGTSGHPIHNWYPGRVTKVGYEGGYGLRCHLAFVIFFELLGRRYQVKGAYAHAKSFSVSRGQYIKQGQVVGVMGNTGGNFPLHVDFRLWINYGNRIVDLSPNVVEAQLRQQENRG